MELFERMAQMISFGMSPVEICAKIRAECRKAQAPQPSSGDLFLHWCAARCILARASRG